MPPTVSIERLHFAYNDGVFQLAIPSLQLVASESVVVSGPSGSGKTTLLNLLSGILPAASGEISVGGTQLQGLSDAARRLFRLKTVGQVFQDFQLIDYLTVFDNVTLPCRIHSAVKLTSELRTRAASLLESVGLAPLMKQSVTRLSQGERQRVAICRALLLAPKIVLADEPTGNLDRHNAVRITSLLLDECRRAHALLVMVTHDQSLLPMFDRVVPFEQFMVPSPSMSKQSSPSASSFPVGGGR